MYHVVTLSRLQELTDSVPVMDRENRINWMQMLSVLLKDDVSAKELHSETEIVVRDINFLYHLLMLLDSTPHRVIGLYQSHFRLSSHILSTGFLSNEHK